MIFSSLYSRIGNVVALNTIDLLLKLIMTSGVAFSVVTLLPRPAIAQFRGNLTVEVDGLNVRSGNVCFSLFDSSQGFPSDSQQAVNAKCVAISADPFQVTFQDLSYGSYAIAAYHDSNMDQQLNQGLLGIPTEGFAFSNDAPALTGPASFQDAVFILSQANATIHIRMRYLGLGDR